jgi:hypothetical protein
LWEKASILQLVLWKENTGWIGLGIEPREAVITMVTGFCKCWEFISTDGLGVQRKPFCVYAVA